MISILLIVIRCQSKIQDAVSRQAHGACPEFVSDVD